MSGPATEHGEVGPYGHSTPYGRSNLDVGDQPEHSRAVKSRRWWVIGALIVTLAITAVLSYRWGSSARPAAVPTATPSASATPPTTAEIYAAVAPSVVSVLAADGAGSGSRGTGVIVSDQAMILTALHVVNGAGSLRVVFADGTEAEAVVVGSDPATDIAALQPLGLPEVVVPAVLGAAGALEVGDRVIAIGDQLGLTRTTTEGVVSGLDRTAPGFAGGPIGGLIQFDAAVNHGSSGGPLVNSDGALVGIVVALANPTADGTFIGISFAVPIGVAVTAGGGDEVPL
jgi:S1-C subfamily serine protease